MPTLNELITFENQNEYESAYDLSLKKDYSNPKIYSANGNLDKRWYVYFSFREPTTGKLKRVTPIYGIANKYKTKEERLVVLVMYKKTLLKLLRQGYNPYSDNTSLHQKKTLRKKLKKTTSVEEQSMALQEAFDFGLKLKSGATLIELRRTKSGAQNIDESKRLTNLLSTSYQVLNVGSAG
ncbi:MAG: hypothetical protein KUG51_02625, partial [Urechidicola sp.]|nr:hypothetical protein [Urechidicola sp.]